MVATFPLLPGTRWVAPLAVLFGIGGAVVATSTAARLFLAGGALLFTLLALLAHRRRPILFVDDEGYRVEEAGRERLRVRWDEVLSARAVPEERSLYLETGERSRNLLLPPPGFGFRYARQGELFARLVAVLGARVEIVPTLVPPEEKEPR